MGRLPLTRARVALTVLLALAVPLAVVAASRMTVDSGAPGVSMTVALVVAHLLSVGPRGAPLAWGAFALHGAVVGGVDPSVGLALVAAVQAAVAVACVRLVEFRFDHHGPVRSPLVMTEYAVVAALALPLLVAGTAATIGPLVGAGPWPGPVVQHALAAGVGVLTVTVGVRMLATGARIDVDVAGLVGIVTAVVVTVGTALVILQLGGVDALAGAQVVVLPLLAVALLIGTAAYALAATAAVIGIVVPVALAGTGGTWSIGTTTHVLWWLVAFAGLLLATDGDRRRAAAVAFRTFFMRSATPSLSVNAVDGTVSRANEAAADLLGIPVEDLVGRPVVGLVDHDPAGAALERLLAGDEEEMSVEFDLSVGPQQHRWVRCVAVRVDLTGPQHDVLQVQFLDLTAEQERTDALLRSNQALERFGRRVTHDLKQPLSAVAAYAGTLNEHGEHMDRSVVRMMYERLEAVARRAVNQLDETFAATAVQEGPAGVANLHEVVATVAGVTDIELTEAGGAIDTSLAVARVNADSSMLRQVLLNVVTNSLKYARDDTPPRIRVTSRIRGAGVEVTVTDNGTGVDADHLEEVFDRGRRLDPARADGRGYGLADSRQLVEDAGGWLRAEPWPSGARFVLWLPDPTVAGAEPATRVLLVEDDPDQLTLLRRRLERQPAIAVVGTATTVHGAVAATRDLQPDVVLLDRWLHEEDGLQGVVALARAHPDVRIVLLTAHVSPDLPDRARSGGVLRTLEKGISDDELVAHVVGRQRR